LMTLAHFNTNDKNEFGFTIVELLVVIVVIGILAAITIVSYTGVSQKALAVSLQSDLASASKQLKIYQVSNDAFPEFNNCSLALSTYICLKSSPGNTLLYTPAAGSKPQTFSLTAEKDSVKYIVTNDSKPSLVIPDPNWLAGQAEAGYPTSLVGKRIYYQNTSGNPQWQSDSNMCVSPQCSGGALVDPTLNPGVIFGALYPSQEACKALGGRLPSTNELSAIYAGKVANHYGSFPGTYYWSAAQGSNNNWGIYVDFGNGGVGEAYKVNGDKFTRCIK